MVKQYNPSNFESIVEEELRKIEELLEEEPNSKCNSCYVCCLHISYILGATLTSIFLMRELPKSAERKEEILKRINVLQKLDPLRINYYKSLESKEAF